VNFGLLFVGLLVHTMKRCLSTGNVGTVGIESSDTVTNVVTKKPRNNKKNHNHNQISASQSSTSHLDKVDLEMVDLDTITLVSQFSQSMSNRTNKLTI